MTIDGDSSGQLGWKSLQRVCSEVCSPVVAAFLDVLKNSLQMFSEVK